MRIFIDADGCPVVKLTMKVAIKNGLKVTVVKNHAVHIENPNPAFVDVATVDTTRDSADYYIANHMSAGDLVITQDYGLAAMVLAKNGYGMSQNGLVFTTFNIDQLLDRRHFNQEMRRKHKKHNSKFKKRTKEDDLKFESALLDFLKQHGQTK